MYSLQSVLGYFAYFALVCMGTMQYADLAIVCEMGTANCIEETACRVFTRALPHFWHQSCFRNRTCLTFHALQIFGKQPIFQLWALYHSDALVFAPAKKGNSFQLDNFQICWDDLRLVSMRKSINILGQLCILDFWSVVVVVSGEDQSFFWICSL